VTITLPQKDSHSISKRYLDDKICILMSGRVAEELIFNELSSGASDDFSKATDIAKKMVCDLGMSKKLGPISYKKDDYSEQTAAKIDNEISKIITTQYNRSRYILENNMQTLHKVANTLIEYETINGHELKDIVNGSFQNNKQVVKKIKIQH
jgi:cell division protease FtsH